MFGVQGGETAEVVARKRSHRKDAQQKWPFLEGQSCSMVKTRAGLSDEQARLDVGAWMRGRQFWPELRGDRWRFMLALVLIALASEVAVVLWAW
jgi:hypothetical protein